MPWFVYHVYDHYLLLKLMSSLRPSTIIIDSLFLNIKLPLSRIHVEDVENPNNAVKNPM